VNAVSDKVVRHSLRYRAVNLSVQIWFAVDVPYYAKVSPKLTYRL